MGRFADFMMIGIIAREVLDRAPMRKVTKSILMTLLAVSVFTACSTQSAKTVESEKTVQYAADAQARPDAVVSETRTTKTEETKTEGQSGGLISGAVDVVGKAIALPFRVVAGLIDVAF